MYSYRSLIRFKRTQFYVYKLKSMNATVPKLFRQTVQKNASRTAFYYLQDKWTFSDIDVFSNRVANCFLESGFHPGEEIALFMDSRPEYVALWLGLAKAGLVTALINTNQRLSTLVHSITVVHCKAIIFSSELIPGMNSCFNN